MHNIQHISDKDIQHHLAMGHVISVMEEVFKHPEKGQMPPKIYLELEGNSDFRAMPAKFGDAVGIKWASIFPQNEKNGLGTNVSATIMLNDIETGYPIALMDGMLITSYRTAAVTGLATKYLAKENAQIGLPELDLGAVPAWGGSARLTKCVGEQHALDMILRSKKVSGPRALEIGLVHEDWPLEELKPAAISLAHELAAQPAKAVESMMKVLVNSSDRDLEDLLKAERQAVKDNSGTKDSQEGMAAFMEKRKPIFNQ